VIGRYGRLGKETSGRHCTQPPPDLRYQNFQFSNINGRLRKRSYRSGLGMNPPRTLEECEHLIPTLARRIHVPNVSVDVEDLMQIGQTVLWEGTQSLRARGARLRPAALKVLLEAAQSAMFHAIDPHLVQLPAEMVASSNDEAVDRWEDTVQDSPGASCNRTIIRQGGGAWEFVPNCCESWGAPLPPGACQPRPTPPCSSHLHLPFRRGEANLPDLR
jgi:hypothetical protein